MGWQTYVLAFGFVLVVVLAVMIVPHYFPMPGAARWDNALGEFVLDWDDVRSSTDPFATALGVLVDRDSAGLRGGVDPYRPAIAAGY